MNFIYLFISACVAATVLPAQSEAVLLYMVAQNTEDVFLLVTVATLGNVLGGTLNYALGRALHKLDKKFQPDKNKLRKAEKIYYKFGRASLLFTFLPLIGDILTILAGIMKEKIWIFLLLISIGKLVRYLFVVGAFAFLFDVH